MHPVRRPQHVEPVAVDVGEHGFDRTRKIDDRREARSHEPMPAVDRIPEALFLERIEDEIADYADGVYHIMHIERVEKLAGRVIDEDEQGAFGTAVLEPSVVRAIDLHQLAEAVAPAARLMELAFALTP